MVKILIYNQIKKFNTRQQAIDFFTDCDINSDGAEQERYDNILQQLLSSDDNFIYDTEENYKRYKIRNKL